MAYVLDTDHIVVLLKRQEPAFSRLTHRLSQVDPAVVYVTIVSFHEQMQGWLALLNHSRSASQIVMAYDELDAVGRAFFEMQSLPFSDDAQQRFAELRKQRVRIGTMDLRIASIALVQDATVLTSNTRDFEKVPGLDMEDWTI